MWPLLRGNRVITASLRRKKEKGGREREGGKKGREGWGRDRGRKEEKRIGRQL